VITLSAILIILEKSDMLDRELQAEFESYRKTLEEKAKRAFDEQMSAC
jgi:hypothetical protein